MNKNKIELSDPELSALSWILETLTYNEIMRNTVHGGCPVSEAHQHAAMLDRLVSLVRKAQNE
jgi:hypothetical protein